MRFSKKIKFLGEEAINIPFNGVCYASIGRGIDDRGYMVLSVCPLPVWCEFDDGNTPMPISDCDSAAIVELTQSTGGTTADCLYRAIKYDEFAKILVATDVEDMSPDTVFDVYHDILAYRHAYVARETTDITRAVDKYNARKFLNEYRNLIINTNGYGTSEEEKAPYLRFIDGEKGAFSVLREL